MRGGRCQEFPRTSTPLIIRRARIFLRGEPRDSFFEVSIQGQFLPVHACNFEEGLFPIGAGDTGRWLNGALHKQTLFGAALGGASDLLVFPKDIELFSASEALA